MEKLRCAAFKMKLSTSHCTKLIDKELLILPPLNRTILIDKELLVLPPRNRTIRLR